MNRKSGAAAALIYAFLANIGVAALKLLASWQTRSTAMLAEGIHSLADSANQILLGLGLRLSRRPPDARHPFGYGKEAYFWGFIVALLMFTVGGMVSISEGVRRFLHPHPLEHPLWNLVILGVGLILEGNSWRIALRSIDPQYRAPTAFFRYARETKDPTLILVIFEDSAAMLGLATAFVCILLAWKTGRPRWDAGASIVIGVLLVAVAFILARETRSLLLGEGLPEKEAEQVQQAVAALPAVREILEFRSLYVGPTSLVIGMTVTLSPEARALSGGGVVRDVEAAVRAIHPDAKYIYVEIADAIPPAESEGA